MGFNSGFKGLNIVLCVPTILCCCFRQWSE